MNALHKSVTMSNFTEEEINSLKEKNGGGNAVARRTWLARVEEVGYRFPKSGDSLDCYKDFIRRAYIEKIFYSEDNEECEEEEVQERTSRTKNQTRPHSKQKKKM